MDKETILVEIAKKFIACNPNKIAITGSLMLKLRGIDLGREIEDLDLIINDYCTNIVFPMDLEFTDIEKASDSTSLKYKYGDIAIDILSTVEDIEVVNGLPLGNLSQLINKKYMYSKQNNESAKKHYDDLIKLGFDFSKINNSNEIFD